MFQIKELSKRYGTEFALRDLTMDIGKGMNFIIGSSGSGKTTLLKILSGMETDYEGEVTYLGRDMSELTEAEKSGLYNGVFGFVWQDFHLLPEATVLENILLPAWLKDEKSEKNAANILRQLRLDELRDQKVKYLSGGQKQRVAIAREMMKDPKLIFCDEPTSALDPESAGMIMDILRSIAKSRTVIVVTHDSALIEERDAVYELDKGELVSAPEIGPGNRPAYRRPAVPRLSFKNALLLALGNIKNNFGRAAVSALCLTVAGTLLLISLSGAIEQSGQSEFQRLVDTYGEGILDIDLVGSFMSASGGEEDRPGGDVSQDLSGLYEKYEEDERVEYIVSLQPFENISLTIDGETYSIEKTGSSPVLTRLITGEIPAGEEYQVVIPLNFAESIGLRPEAAIGKELLFNAAVYQWVNGQPLEKPVELRARICGVADNTVVYDYEGEQYSFTVDDSFFFNRSAIEELRKQAGIEDESANFTIRAKTPEALISLKDELNREGIVPLGRFELVEDIVRLDQQTVRQSGSAGAVVGALALLSALGVFTMSSLLRKREYAIYKISGYGKAGLAEISLGETLLTAAAAIALLLAASPVLDRAASAMFGASILSAKKLAVGAALILTVSLAAFAAALPAAFGASCSDMLKAGDRS